MAADARRLFPETRIGEINRAIKSAVAAIVAGDETATSRALAAARQREAYLLRRRPRPDHHNCP